MAPEQAAGDPNLDHRADIYAVGVLAYEMLEGQPPFTGTPQSVMSAHLTKSPRAMSRADVPSSLQRTVLKCLEKDPAHRFQSADELLADIESIATPSGALPSAQRAARPRARLGRLAAAVAAIAWFSTAPIRRARWVRREAIPQIKQYADLAQYDSAWMLARRAKEILPDDSTLASLWLRFARKAVLRSTPAGASAYRASFDDTTRWISLGTTPTDSIWLPLGTGRVRVEKAGFRTQYGLMGAGSRMYMLDSAAAPDSDMAHIPGGTFGVFLVGLDVNRTLKLGDYMMDKREVTNRQYKAFVDAGGYTKREYWPAELTSEGVAPTFEAAMAKFTDKTGRPGPSTWEAGAYPVGQADFPVGGGAGTRHRRTRSSPASRCRRCFTGRARPRRTRLDSSFPGAASRARRRARGAPGSLGAYGVFDLAGTYASGARTRRPAGASSSAAGGATSPYQFTDGYAQPPTDRAAINGIRLVRYLHTDDDLARAKAPQPRAFTDYTAVACAGRRVRGIPAHLRLRSKPAERARRLARHDAGRLGRGARELRCRVRQRAHGGGAAPPEAPRRAFPARRVLPAPA